MSFKTPARSRCFKKESNERAKISHNSQTMGNYMQNSENDKNKPSQQVKHF